MIDFSRRIVFNKDEFFVYYGLVPIVANPSLGHRTAEFSSGELVKKKINGGNAAVPNNDEISPGVSWRLTKAARYPFNPSAIAQLLGRGNGLILKVRVTGPDLACDAIDLVSAAEYTPRRIVKCAIFVVDLVDGRAPTRRVVFTEDVAKIAGQQGRYAVGHDVSRIVGDYNYNAFRSVLHCGLFAIS